eukprot:gene2228-4327_t
MKPDSAARDEDEHATPIEPKESTQNENNVDDGEDSSDNSETALGLLLSVAEGMGPIKNKSQPVSKVADALAKNSTDEIKNTAVNQKEFEERNNNNHEDDHPSSDDSGEGYEDGDDKNSAAANLRKKRKRELSRASHARMRQQIGSKLQRVVALLREFRKHDSYRYTVGVASNTRRREATPFGGSSTH